MCILPKLKKKVGLICVISFLNFTFTIIFFQMLFSISIINILLEQSAKIFSHRRHLDFIFKVKFRSSIEVL